MTHLTADELIDAMEADAGNGSTEGVLPAERRVHLASCEYCRAQLDDLAGALNDAKQVSVPEPSPLFWNHFAQRVDQGIGSHDARAGWLAGLTSIRGLTAAGAIAALVLIAVMSRETRHNEITPAATPVATADPLFEPDAPGTDDGWEAVREAAEHSAWDDAHAAALAPRPDAADRAIDNLTEAERATLLTLLAEDLKKSGE